VPLLERAAEAPADGVKLSERAAKGALTDMSRFSGAPEVIESDIPELNAMVAVWTFRYCSMKRAWPRAARSSRMPWPLIIMFAVRPKYSASS
jgi:hypothetical protein